MDFAFAVKYEIAILCDKFNFCKAITIVQHYQSKCEELCEDTSSIGQQHSN